jgi:hypothetical protein
MTYLDIALENLKKAQDTTIKERIGMDLNPHFATLRRIILGLEQLMAFANKDRDDD